MNSGYIIITIKLNETFDKYQIELKIAALKSSVFLMTTLHTKLIKPSDVLSIK